MSALARAGLESEGLADALDLGLCGIDAEGLVVERNRSWVRLLHDAPDPLGTRFADWAAGLAPPLRSVLTEVAERVAQLRPGGEDRPVFVLDVHAEASLRHVDLGARRLPAPATSGACVMVTAQDVTERMRDRAISSEQREASSRLDMLTRYTDSAVAVLDLDGVIEWVSDTYAALTGFTRAEVVGRRHWDLVRGPFRGTETFRRFEAETNSGRLASVEAPLHRADGSLYWASWTVQPMHRDGQVMKLLSIQRDITKRRRAEEMARQTLVRAQRLGAELRQEKHLMTSVLATVPHGVWWKDAELTYLGCNDAYVQLRGLASMAEMVGRKEQQLQIDDRFGPQLTELEEQVAAGAEPVSDRRLTIAEPGQPLRTFLVSVLPRMENRRLAGVLGVCTDVSQLSELERQVSQTSRLESIGQLAAGIAHEINTPVQYASDNVRFATESFDALFGGLRQLQAMSRECADPDMQARVSDVITDLDLDFLAEEVPSALAQSQEGLDRVAQIVRAMKEFSHPGGERTSTDINQLVESTIQVSRNEWKYVARLEQALGSEVGEIPCYAGDLKQALLNILVNAAHAVDERRRQQGTDELGLITVGTSRTADEVTISVTDSGIGMSEDVRQRIFDPFFTTKGVGKGTGQGLSLAYSAVVAKHHGRIEVTSTPMRGSAFALVLPAMPGGEPLPEMAADVLAGGTAPRADGAGEGRDGSGEEVDGVGEGQDGVVVSSEAIG